MGGQALPAQFNFGCPFVLPERFLPSCSPAFLIAAPPSASRIAADPRIHRRARILEVCEEAASGIRICHFAGEALLEARPKRKTSGTWPGV